MDHIIKHQQRIKAFFNKRSRPRKFMKGNLVLLWDKRHEPKGMHNKFDSLWKGPFKIEKLNQNNSFMLAFSTREILSLSYNGGI